MNQRRLSVRAQSMHNEEHSKKKGGLFGDFSDLGELMMEGVKLWRDWEVKEGITLQAGCYEKGSASQIMPTEVEYLSPPVWNSSAIQSSTTQDEIDSQHSEAATLSRPVGLMSFRSIPTDPWEHYQTRFGQFNNGDTKSGHRDVPTKEVFEMIEIGDYHQDDDLNLLTRSKDQLGFSNSLNSVDPRAMTLGEGECKKCEAGYCLIVKGSCGREVVMCEELLKDLEKGLTIIKNRGSTPTSSRKADHGMSKINRNTSGRASRMCDRYRCTRSDLSNSSSSDSSESEPDDIDSSSQSIEGSASFELPGSERQQDLGRLVQRRYRDHASMEPDTFRIEVFPGGSGDESLGYPADDPVVFGPKYLDPFVAAQVARYEASSSRKDEIEIETMRDGRSRVIFEVPEQEVAPNEPGKSELMQRESIEHGSRVMADPLPIHPQFPI